MKSPEPPAAPDEAWFLEIESHFAGRRGTPFVFSAKDWALLKSWKEEGIPLSVVLEAIEVCFEKREKSGRKGTISSLSYCRHAVREIWAERRDLQVGAGGGVPERDSEALLERLAGELAGAAAASASAGPERALERAAEAVRGLAAGDPVPALEQRLLEIEQRMIGELRESLSDADLAALSAEVDRGLAGHALDPRVAARTREANLLRLMRRRFGVPRLSLFG
ncbi:MAG TPA: hypothetical protein VMS56_16130 [Thermoanaerobaculia bacterium]|nr:hypothetical protein [Thermoanaerobaculia bacterium]